MLSVGNTPATLSVETTAHYTYAERRREIPYLLVPMLSVGTIPAMLSVGTIPAMLSVGTIPAMLSVETIPAMLSVETIRPADAERRHEAEDWSLRAKLLRSHLLSELHYNLKWMRRRPSFYTRPGSFRCRSCYAQRPARRRHNVPGTT